MKKSTFFTCLFTLSCFGLFAQLKIGKNPKSILPNTMFQIESANGKNLIVDTASNIGLGTTSIPLSFIHITDNKAPGIGHASNTQMILTNKLSAPSIVFQNNSPSDGVISMISKPGTSNGALIRGDFLIGGAQDPKGFAVGGNFATANPIYNFVVTFGGKIGCGTDNPQTRLEVEGGSGITISTKDSGLQSLIFINSKNATGSISDWKLYKGDGGNYPSGLHLFSYPRNSTSFGGCCHPRMTWLDNGRVGINQVNPSNALDLWSQDSTWAQRINNTAYTGLGLLIDVHQITNGSELLAFNRQNIRLGSITYNGTGVSYNATSDFRLKENIKNTQYSLSDLMKVKVMDYFYKSDTAHNFPSTGFIAQDLYKIYPIAVTVGGADVAKNPWSIDYSKLTPLIVKALQDFKNEYDKNIQELISTKEELKKQKEMLESIMNELKIIKLQNKK